MSDKLESQPKIYTIGKWETAGLLDQAVNVEEKVDGSQFSFGFFPSTFPYMMPFPLEELRIRSKSQQINPASPPGMFLAAVEYVKNNIQRLKPNYTYRGEVLSKPKHNVLKYSRVPVGNVIIFDILNEKGEYLSYGDKWAEASRLGLEVAPLLWSGTLDRVDGLASFFSLDSCLGGTKIEGVVVKPTAPNGAPLNKDGGLLMGKVVSDAFKEVAKSGVNRPLGEGSMRADIVAILAERYATKARFQKSVQHLRELGVLVNSPKDIGPIVIEMISDVFKEEEHEIQEALLDWVNKDLRRAIVADVPRWYKQVLMGGEDGQE